MYTLYWSPGTAAFGPQVVLEEIGADYETIFIDTRNGENFSPEFLALNPAGKVPALQIPGGPVLHEAAAIMLYLAEKHGRTDFAPAMDDPIRGEFLSTYFYLTTTVQNAHKQFYYPHRFTTDQAQTDPVKNQACFNITEDWAVIEKRLTAGGPFHFGDRYTLCDMFAVMLITWNPDPKQLLADFPGLNRCYQAARERPAMAKCLEIHE